VSSPRSRTTISYYVSRWKTARKNRRDEREKDEGMKTEKGGAKIEKEKKTM
jgi:hypothetical protein